MSRAADLFGKNDINAVGIGPSPMVPWPAAGARKDLHSYDKSLVHEAVRSGQKTEKVDPRNLHATQPSLDRGGLGHYMNNTSGELYRPGTDPGNKNPVVYVRKPLYENQEPQHMLLSGHHRATAALLRGEQFDAVVVHGPWGAPR